MNAVIASIIISAITGIFAWLAARQSSKAAVTNSVTSGRVEMEKEAYERARKLDTETINRQDGELKELEEKYEKLQDKYDAVYEQNQQLNNDVSRMTHDNYQLHRENTRVLEMNEQHIAENQRLRRQGELLMRELNDLRRRVLDTFPQQQGQQGLNTDPMMEVIQTYE